MKIISLIRDLHCEKNIYASARAGYHGVVEYYQPFDGITCNGDVSKVDIALSDGQAELIAIYKGYVSFRITITE